MERPLKEVSVFRADDVRPSLVPDLVIRAHISIGVIDDHPLKKLNFDRDSNALADALFTTLPGGTIDQLLVRFLRRRASELVVATPAEDSITGLPDPLDLLRQIQWKGCCFDHCGNTYSCCPVCSYSEIDGHADDCKLAKAVA